MKEKYDFTNGKSFLSWLFSGSGYAYWYLIMTFGSLFLLINHKDFKLALIIFIVEFVATFILYRVYRKMKKGESG